MKKMKLFIAALVLASANDPFFEANLEALTEIEEGGSGVMCTQTCTPGNYFMLRCGDCDALPNKYAMDSVAFCFL